MMELIGTVFVAAAGTSFAGAVLNLGLMTAVAHKARAIDLVSCNKLERDTRCEPTYVIPGVNLVLAAKLGWGLLTGFKGEQLTEADKRTVALAVGLKANQLESLNA